MKSTEQIKAMYRLLKSPKKWVKDSWALNKHGEDVPWQAKDAFCFCLLSAIHRTSKEWYVTDAERYIRDAVKDLTKGRCRGIITFNDHERTTHADILVVLRRAYRAAKQAGD